MPPFLSARHTGKNAVTNKINFIAEARRDRVEMKVIKEGLDSIYQQVFKDAPHKSGKMKTTIGTSVDDDDGIIYVGIYYSYWVEHGSSRNSAYPFFFGYVHAGVEVIKMNIRNAYGMGSGMTPTG